MEASILSAGQAEAEQAFADAITQAVHSKYESLPQRGKPLQQEWTVLAGIVATTHDVDAAARGEEQNLSKVAGTARVVALATGTKCLGPSRMSEQGWVIHDCHAEVLCRRALVHCILNWLDSDGGGGSDDSGDNSLAWLLEKLPLSSDEGGASGGGLTKRVRLKPGVQLHLYISDSPCGDGALVGEYVPRHAQPKDAQVAEVAAGDGDKQPGQMMPSVSPQGDTPESIVDQAAPAPKRARVGRITGAKPAAAYGADVVAKDAVVVADDPSSHAAGASSSSAARAPKREENRHQQAVGALRTKSGRSDLSEQDRTMCMSCSDKILLWNLVGMQGALLAGVMDGPLLLSSVIVGADALWPDLTRSHVTEVVSRAVFGRLGATDAWKSEVHVNVPRVAVSSIGFERSRPRVSQGKTKATGQSICWVVGDGKKAGEVLANARGAKQGVTAKNWNTGKTSSRLCKRKLGELAARVLLLRGDDRGVSKLDTNTDVPYNELKERVGAEYRQRKKSLMTTSGILKDWVVAPERFSAFALGLR